MLLGSLYKFPVLTLIITLETMVMGNMAIPWEWAASIYGKMASSAVILFY